ncbi:hypothetical protein [Glycomyces buryatensis]|uniref:Uncharacterized protein n=1 Tax=Glycomyces buryatensis TaxID=2570927 RepID=A0A4S8QA51_9ACTN|nr:hypothetical protein [Glycomyces buryatensis]THV39645.1 hypothetical protein FAB82_17400 [Glycomyces buryatensis]
MTFALSYDPTLWHAKATIAKHQPIPILFGLLYQCEAFDCREITRRKGCTTRRKNLETYNKRAEPAEKRRSVDAGYLFSNTEALNILPPKPKKPAPAPVPAIPAQRPPAPIEQRRPKGRRFRRKPTPRHRYRDTRHDYPIEPVKGAVA